MVMMTYKIPDSISQIAMQGEFNEFDLNVFFQAEGKGEEAKFIYLKTRGGELKYPRPDNLVTLAKDKFEKGETVCCAYNTSSPISKLNSMIDLMRARKSAGLRYFEKDNILI